MQFSSSVRISVTHYNVKCLIFIKYFLSAAREFENIFDSNFLQYVNQVLRSTRKYEFISQKASCAGTVALSAHMGLSLFQAHSISLSVRNGQFNFHLIINSFIFTIRHYSSLFITIRHYSSLFVTIRHYSSLFVTIHHYSRLVVIIRHYSRLFPVFGRYSGSITGQRRKIEFNPSFVSRSRVFTQASIHILLSSLLQATGFVLKKRKVHVEYIGVVFFMKHGKVDYRDFVDLKDRRCQRATDLSLPSLVDQNIGWLPL